MGVTNLFPQFPITTGNKKDSLSCRGHTVHTFLPLDRTREGRLDWDKGVGREKNFHCKQLVGNVFVKSPLNIG